jgi:hypothetical protein
MDYVQLVMSEPAKNQPSTPALPTSHAKPADTVAPAVASPDGKPVNQLSKEEQMAAFEEDLKYNDWGHQPC